MRILDIYLATWKRGGLHVDSDDLPDKALQDVVECLLTSRLPGPSPHLHKMWLFSSLALLGAVLFYRVKLIIRSLLGSSLYHLV